MSSARFKCDFFRFGECWKRHEHTDGIFCHFNVCKVIRRLLRDRTRPGVAVVLHFALQPEAEPQRRRVRRRDPHERFDPRTIGALRWRRLLRERRTVTAGLLQHYRFVFISRRSPMLDFAMECTFCVSRPISGWKRYGVLFSTELNSFDINRVVSYQCRNKTSRLKSSKCCYNSTNTTYWPFRWQRGNTR